jgi:mannose-6-phosphate isomerase
MALMPLESEDRPWGSWHVIDVGPGYKIKRIHVKPGTRLSLQTHQYRSEHWVVVFGVATAVIDDVTITAGPGDSVDVPRGAQHRLANEGVEDLVIVEVQHGAYTGEDDIVRLDDDFGRHH